MPSEKTMAYRTSNVVRAAWKIAHLGRLYKKNKLTSKRVLANK